MTIQDLLREWKRFCCHHKGETIDNGLYINCSECGEIISMLEGGGCAPTPEPSITINVYINETPHPTETTGE